MNEFGKMRPTRLAQVIPLKGDTKSSAQYAPRLPVARNDRGGFGARDPIEQVLTTAGRSRATRAFVMTLRQSPAPALPADKECAQHPVHREPNAPGESDKAETASSETPAGGRHAAGLRR